LAVPAAAPLSASIFSSAACCAAKVGTETNAAAAKAAPASATQDIRRGRRFMVLASKEVVGEGYPLGGRSSTPRLTAGAGHNASRRAVAKTLGVPDTLRP
jgi:hypothetical protein